MIVCMGFLRLREKPIDIKIIQTFTQQIENNHDKNN